jgi:hypothetical protein
MTSVQRRRIVKFVKEPSTYVYEAYGSDILWETEEEFNRGRAASRKDGKQAREDGWGELLEDSFAFPCEDVQKRLNEYVKMSDARGVERFTCKSHYQERKELRARSIKAVLIAQSQAQQKGLNDDAKAEQLREVALLYCVEAKVYARRLGKADEVAVRPKKKTARTSSKKSLISTQGSSKSLISTQGTSTSRLPTPPQSVRV